MEAALLLAGAALLAYANGANDNFKVVATLYGSQTLGYRAALALTTAATLLGSLVSLWLARGLVRTFSGKGLVADSVITDPGFLTSVGLGAGATVLLAALVGLPISTTHSIVGALVGAGLVWAGAVDLGQLGGAFLLPLLVSPLLALGLTALIYPLLRGARGRLGVEPETRVRLEAIDEQPAPVPAGPVADLSALERVEMGAAPPLQWVVEGRRDDSELAVGSEKSERGLDAATALDVGHVFSAGALGFARGLNDTPKIAALLAAAPAIGMPWSVALVAVVMAAGGLFNSRRVAETMSHEITTLNAGQGFTANAVSAALVICASRMGVPVSTTHVTCGALFGIGASTGQGRWPTIVKIALAWVATLPIGAALAALVAVALR